MQVTLELTEECVDDLVRQNLIEAFDVSKSFWLEHYSNALGGVHVEYNLEQIEALTADLISLDAVIKMYSTPSQYEEFEKEYKFTSEDLSF